MEDKTMNEETKGRFERCSDAIFHFFVKYPFVFFVSLTAFVCAIIFMIVFSEASKERELRTLIVNDEAACYVWAFEATPRHSRVAVNRLEICNGIHNPELFRGRRQ